MKNAFVLATFLIISFVIACNNAHKSDMILSPQSEIQVASQAVIDLKDITYKDSIPAFSDPEVQAYVEAYESYVDRYRKAMAKNDIRTIAALATRGQILGNKAQKITSKVSGTEAERLAAFMIQKNREIQALFPEQYR